MRFGSIALGLVELLLLCGLLRSAGAGVRLGVEMFDQRHTPSQTFAGTIWIDGERVRMQDSVDTSGPTRNTLIYRGDLDVFWSLDPQDRRYVESDRSLLTEIDRRIAAAQRELEARMAILPPDQRAMARRLIGARASESRETREPLRFRPTSERRRAGASECRVIEISRSEERIGDACVVAWDRAPVTRDELAVFRKLAHFLRDLMGAVGPTPLELVPNQSFSRSADRVGGRRTLGSCRPAREPSQRLGPHCGSTLPAPALPGASVPRRHAGSLARRPCQRSS